VPLVLLFGPPATRLPHGAEPDDFVSQTLLGILSGVQKAIEGAAAIGGRVSPEMALGGRTQMVEFDVEVTTATGTGTQAKAGVFVGPVALGTQGQLEK